MRSRRVLLAAGALAVALAALALIALLRSPRGERVEPVRADGRTARVARSQDAFAPEEPEVARTPLESTAPSAPAPQRARRDDLRWIAGRVAIPNDTPVDEDLHVVALARGREVLARAPVAAGGAFRLGLERDVRSVHLDLDARWLVLAEPLRVRTSRVPDPLVLEPVLGGALRVELVPPDASYLAEVVGRELELRASRQESPRTWATVWRRRAIVADDLTCRFRAIDPELRLELAGRFATLRPIDKHSLHVEAGREVGLRIELRPGVLLRGLVRDEKGAPRPDARIELRRAVGGYASSTGADVRIDEQGRFVVGPAVPGELSLAASCDGYLATCRELGRLDEGERRDGIELVLARGATLAGHVELADGSPPGYCELELEPGLDGATDPCNGRRWLRATTDEEGRFAVSGLLPVAYEVEVKAWRRRLDHRREPPIATGVVEGARAADGPLVVVLGGGAPVRGVVRDERGAPLAGVHVRARDERDLHSEGGLEARSGADGTFELDAVDPGLYTFRAEPEDRAPLVLEKVEVPLAEPLELVLPTPASLSGRVLDPDGVAAAGAELAWLPHWGYASMQALRHGQDEPATCDASGRFELTGLPASLVQVLAWTDGLAPNEPLKLQLSPGEHREGLELRLRALGRIEGTVLDAQDRPDAGVAVRLSMNADGPAITDEEGAFAFDALPPGGYSLLAAVPAEWSEREGKPGGGAWLLEHFRRAEVELGEGETARVVLRPDSNAAEILLHGVVTAGGRPAAGAEVSTGDWTLPRKEWTDAEGRYELGLPGPGQHVVRVHPRDGGTRAFPVDVADAPRAQRDFALGGGSIAGRVLDHEGAAAAGARVSLSRRREQPDEPEGGGYASCDAEGHFELEQLDSGRYELRVIPRTYEYLDDRDLALGAAPLRLEELALGEGERLDGLELRLPAAGVLTGRVLDASGLPVAHAAVLLHDERGRFVEAALNVHTDGAGRFRVTRAGGTVRTFAVRTGEASPPSAPIVLDAEHPARVELQLAPATTLRVEVRNGPALESELEVIARDEHGLEHDRFAFWQAGERLEPTLPGHTLGPLPPGRYRIEARTLQCSPR